MEYSNSCLIITQLRFQVSTVVLVVMRLVLYWTLRYIIDIYFASPHECSCSSSSSAAASTAVGAVEYGISTAVAAVGGPPAPSSSSSSSSSLPYSTEKNKLVIETEIVTSYKEIKIRSDDLPESSCSSTCAVCLDELKNRDKVRELRNCCHVFHRKCINRWYFNHNDVVDKTCPLCRSPLLLEEDDEEEQVRWTLDRSWTVERLLYLFGDDLF